MRDFLVEINEEDGEMIVTNSENNSTKVDFNGDIINIRITKLQNALLEVHSYYDYSIVGFDKFDVQVEIITDTGMLKVRLKDAEDEIETRWFDGW